MKTPYLQVKDPIVDEWIKIDTRTRSIINKRDFPYLYTPFGTSENLEEVREFQRRLREHRKDIEATLWFGNVEAILREQAKEQRE